MKSSTRRQESQRQHGVALLVALLVVALAAVLIGALLDHGELVAARTRNQLRQAQAQAYAQGLEAYAARVLQEDENNSSGMDTTDAIWAVPLPPTPVPGGIISATMSDLNGRFNLNNLDPKGPNPTAWRAKFVLLLQALKLDPQLAVNVVAWMNADPAASAGDAGDAYYLAQPVPYRAGQREFMHVSELRLVKGVDGDIYAQLAPYVSALPPGTPINVNTAGVPVLMTLGGNVTEQMAQALWQQGHPHYANVAAVAQAQPAMGVIEHPECYGVRSSYFVARGEIDLDNLPFTFYSLIERRIGPGGGIRVIARYRGGD